MWRPALSILSEADRRFRLGRKGARPLFLVTLRECPIVEKRSALLRLSLQRPRRGG